MDLFKRFVVLTVHRGSGCTPKLHLTAHLLSRIADLGSSSLYSNFLDESLNKTLKRACRNASQLTFEAGILCRMIWVLRQECFRTTSVFEARD